MKLKHFAIPTALLALLLSGCGKQSITTQKQVYSADKVSATIKGTAKNLDKIDYQINNGTKHSVKVNQNTFFFQVPATLKNQTVKISHGSLNKTVTVNKQTSLGKYEQIKKSYNNNLVNASLPKDLTKQAVELQKQQAQLKALAKKDPQQAQTQAAELMQKSTKFKEQFGQASKQAKTKLNDQFLPDHPKDGIQDLVTAKNYTIQGNLDQGQTLSLVLGLKTKDLSSTAGQKAFGTALSLLANSTGANAQEVLKSFGKEVKEIKKNPSSTKSTTITNHGVKFDTAFSAKNIYILITK